LANREIARVIGRTAETVKAHLKNIMEKLEVGGRTEAVMQAVRRGIIRVDWCNTAREPPREDCAFRRSSRAANAP
jgi:predicted transcriptional regulator